MKIVTAVVNNPIFIEIQYHTLKKYFQGDYEFIVFNDAKDFPDFSNYYDITMKRQIQSVCRYYNIPCIDIPNKQHQQNMNAAVRCADTMNFILEYQKLYPDKYLFLDSDMFLIDFFDINKYADYDCAIVLQSRRKNTIHYFWNGIYYFDMNKIKNVKLLNWNCCPDCDVGGMMHLWLSTQTNKNIYFIKHLSSTTWDINELPERLKKNKTLTHFLTNDIRNINGKFFCEIYDNVFFHYRAGGNWRNEGKDIHKMLSHQLHKMLFNINDNDNDNIE